MVRPYLLRHEAEIDSAGEKLTKEVSTRVRRVSKSTIDWLNIKKKQVGDQLVAEIKKAAVAEVSKNNDDRDNVENMTPPLSKHDKNKRSVDNVMPVD